MTPEYCPHCFAEDVRRYGVYMDDPRWLCAQCCVPFRTDGRKLGGHYSSAADIQSVRSAFASGLGIRAAARAVGISQITVRSLIRHELVKVGRCGCGEDARHRGWCWWRFARSTARQAFISSWNPVRTGGGPALLLRWPYTGREDELLTLINAHAPKHWPEQVRADICQETAMLLLDGSYDTALISHALAEGRKRIYALFPVHQGAPRSLSAPNSEDDDRTLENRLMASRPFFRLGDIVREKNNGVCPINLADTSDVEIDEEIADVMWSDAHPKFFRPLNGVGLWS